MPDLTSYSASDLVRLMSTREVSPVEVMEAHLAAVDRINPKLNAIVTMAPDVLDLAQQAEAALASDRNIGPLHGLPVTIKDTIETAGLRSTSGSRARENFVPGTDAPSVRLLKQAGAIIFAKTNAAELAMEYTADNPVFGRTSHPQNPSLTPGGSSGGEAAAIAAGMSPCGLGTDMAGSIRIPAHFCGIAGLKPTVGAIPGGGQFPPATGPYSLAAVIGPMARRVNDLQMLFDVLSPPVVGRESLLGQRAAWYANDGIVPVSEETQTAIANAAAALAEAGWQVSEQQPPAVSRGHELWMKLFSRASVLQLRKVYGDDVAKAGDFARWRLQRAEAEVSPALDEYVEAWTERDRLRAKLIEWMRDTPLLIAPVGATAAYPHDSRKLTVAGQTFSTFRAFSYSQTFNVFDLPVVVVRAGKSPAGLPIGVQLVGRPFEERTVLAAAATVEAAWSDLR
ncbi:MAG TPA: amidase [Pyrinomonadaceae bacterium]|nr:amidase [Pyrinomonadaceae bacterium]